MPRRHAGFGLAMAGMLPPFLRPAKISSGGVKLKSCQHQHDVLLVGLGRADRVMISGAAIKSCSCNP